MSQDSDLSAYERVRLENIRKNNEFLASLGLFPSAPKAATVKKVIDAEIREKKVRQKRTVEDAVPLEKRRRSGRLSGHVVKLEELPDDSNDESEPVDETPFYERIPQESDQLDDFEFQAFVELRRWRLLRSRELSIEPFKIFQNRTFCDMVRRRRNNPGWASRTAGGAIVKTEEVEGASEPVVKIESSETSAEHVKSEHQIQTQAHVKQEVKVEHGSSTEQEAETQDEIVYDPPLIEDLTDCFGIAGGKTKEGGFAWEALAALNRTKVCGFLQQSRELKEPLLAEV